ncbi:MAG: SRPBCC domain-containing protein [Halobacteriales archaeon]|nr:SRPBCC domain-containing protein [Halobacteriales archaeon]
MTTKTTKGSDRAFTLTHTFRAPAARIFAAYTDPKQVAQWWDPKGGLRVERMDVRVGGGFRYVQRAPDGGTMAFVGSYLEVKPVTRLVYTFQMEGQPGAPVTTTVDLAEAAGTTTLTLTLDFPSKEAHDAAMQYGAAAGAKIALDNLASFLGAP